MIPFVVLFITSFTSFLAWSPASADSIAPGLSHSEFECTVNSHPMRFEELRWNPASSTELRILSNPKAVQNSRCRHGYGGPDLPALVQSTDAPKNFEVLAATNGTLFRVVNRKASDGSVIHGYAPNHLLWSEGSGLVAPLRPTGGNTLFIADAKGGHEFRMKVSSCGKLNCAQVQDKRKAFKHPLNSDDLIRALRTIHPKISFAIQINMPLSDGARYAECPTDSAGRPKLSDWRCARAARTVLCARDDGSVSLLTTEGAYPIDVAQGLKPKGSCRTGCRWIYNLDGGGSTQMGYLTPSHGKRKMAGARPWVMNGSSMETSEPGCSPYRPVDHYLSFGRRF